MAKYSAQLKATSNQNKSITTTISNVNPEAEPIKVKEFAQRLNQLTTNTYTQTDYIVTTNLDTETPPIPPEDTRQTPTITLTATPSAAAINSNDGQQFFANYTGDGDWYMYIRRAGNYDYDLNFVKTSVAQARIVLKNVTATGIPVGTIIGLVAEGTENYKPITVEFTVEA